MKLEEKINQFINEDQEAEKIFYNIRKDHPVVDGKTDPNKIKLVFKSESDAEDFINLLENDKKELEKLKLAGNFKDFIRNNEIIEIFLK